MMPMVLTKGPVGARYAPRFASMSKRMPTMRPEASSASSPRDSDVARLLVGEEHFRAAAGPLHRPPERSCGEERSAVLGIEVEAHAEAAADLFGDHADLLRRHAEHRRELGAHVRRALRAGVEVVHALGRHPGREARARLHRVAHHARVVDGELHDFRGAGKRSPGLLLVPRFVIQDDISRHLVVHERRARGHGVLRRDDGGKVAIVDRHELRGIVSRDRRLGDDDRDRVAGEAHASLRERRTARMDELGAAAALDRQRGGKGLQLLDIRAGEDGQHAGMRERRRRVDGNDLGVRAIGAHEVRMRLAGEIPVGDVAPPTGKHALVFEAPFQLCRHKDGFTPETSLNASPGSTASFEAKIGPPPSRGRLPHLRFATSRSGCCTAHSRGATPRPSLSTSAPRTTCSGYGPRR